MGSFLEVLLLAWIEIQKEQFPHMVKKWRRTKVPCGRKWPDWVREMAELASRKLLSN